MTEICQDEVFILDHEGPVVSQGSSTGMPDLVVEPTAGYVSWYMRQTQFSFRSTTKTYSIIVTETSITNSSITTNDSPVPEMETCYFTVKITVDTFEKQEPENV